MNDKSKTIDQDGAEVLDPKKALMEQTLAVDLAMGEIDRQIATAHKYPRSIDVVVKRISTLALYNEESAENCIYSLPRAGKPIIGASIGFANIVLQAWGNCRAASRITYIDVRQKVVMADGAFLDLETNAQSVVPVNRRIVDKYGKLYSEDMQIVTGMAAASIARRNAILQGVPRGIWHPIWTEALGIVRGSVETFAEKREKALKAMAQFGITPAQVVMMLGLKGEADLTFEHIPSIRGYYVALRDGSISVEELTDPRRMTGTAFETVDNPLGDEEPGGEEPDEAAVTGGAAAPDPKPQAQTATVQPAKTTAPAAQAKPPVEQAKPAATQAAPQAQNAQASAAAAPAADPDDPRTQPAATATQVKPTASAAPPSGDIQAMREKLANEDEYFAYWEAFLGAAKNKTAIQTQWSNDRGVRGNCGIIGGAFDQAKALKEARERELEQAAG